MQCLKGRQQAEGVVCLCDNKVIFPNNLKSELERGCGKNYVRVLLLGRGLFLNDFLSVTSRRVSGQWKWLGGAKGWVSWVGQ